MRCKGFESPPHASAHRHAVSVAAPRPRTSRVRRPASPPRLGGRALHHHIAVKERHVMTQAANLGFPRIGIRRELKQATEAYWKGSIDASALLAAGAELRAR